jgi:Tol biopolymer transport system component
MILKPGGNIEEPLPEGENQGVPTWSRYGRNLVFGDWPSYGKGTSPMGLHILDLFTRRATPMEGSEALWTPRWSPDGAYISALRRNSKALMLTGAGKSSWREIMTGEDLDDPTWSSDSRHIYLTAQTRRELRRVDVLTGKIEQLADLRGFLFTREQWFGVTPDGSPLALQAFPEQEIYRLRWMLP